MEEAFKHVVEAAKTSGVGFWELVLALCVVVLVFRTPEILKSIFEFVNAWRGISHTMKLKQDATQRRLETARQKRQETERRRKDGSGANR